MPRKDDTKKTAGIRGEERKRYFEEGGTLAGWRGTSSIQKNRKDKRKNRRTRQQEAIRQSSEE